MFPIGVGVARQLTRFGDAEVFLLPVVLEVCDSVLVVLVQKI